MSSKALIHLQDYCDILESLPLELSRNYTQMRELDLQSLQSTQTLKDHLLQFLSHLSTLSLQEKQSQLNHLSQICSNHLKYAHDKVTLASSTLDMVLPTHDLR
jgi:hypothetical protein